MHCIHTAEETFSYKIDTECDSKDALPGVRTDSWHSDENIGLKLHDRRRPDGLKVSGQIQCQ